MSERPPTLETLTAGFVEALGVDPGPELATYVAEGHGTLPGTGKLLAWDANSIHGFVFGTTNATAIRGASSVLQGLDEELRGGTILRLKPSQILFAGGASGLAVVSDKKAPEVIDKLHRLFAERTLTATCCAATVDLGTGDRPFDRLYEDAQNELTRDRVLRGSDAEPGVPFFAARCEVCGRRAATTVAEKRISGPRRECEVCTYCIERGKANRHDQQESSDFGAIADEKRGGFLAVVYADGNGIGKRISRLPSPLAYAKFSRAIATVVRGSFMKLVNEYRLTEEGEAMDDRERRGAYQLPICGGDDLVAILPGDVGVPFARDLLSEVEQAADANEDLKHEAFADLDPIGVAAGVAIGKQAFPIRHLLQEAEELLKTAKKRVYGPDSVRSALDFAEVADGSPRRESAEPERLGREVPRLLETARPYSLKELERFSRRFGVVRGVGSGLGRSQLYQVRRFARLGLNQLRNHLLYQLGRREEWRDLITDLATLDGEREVVSDPDLAMKQFVPEYGGHRVFDVADMIELYDHWREGREVNTP